jgi:polyhydroxyalkanoate synthesis regulator protein
MIVLKRYRNRKIYRERRGYVSLAEVAEWIRAGEDIRVGDHRGLDVTAATLAHIIQQEADGRVREYPVDALLALVRRAGAGVAADAVETAASAVQ